MAKGHKKRKMNELEALLASKRERRGSKIVYTYWLKDKDIEKLQSLLKKGG